MSDRAAGIMTLLTIVIIYLVLKWVYNTFSRNDKNK